MDHHYLVPEIFSGAGVREGSGQGDVKENSSFFGGDGLGGGGGWGGVTEDPVFFSGFEVRAGVKCFGGLISRGAAGGRGAGRAGLRMQAQHSCTCPGTVCRWYPSDTLLAVLKKIQLFIRHIGTSFTCFTSEPINYLYFKMQGYKERICLHELTFSPELCPHHRETTYSTVWPCEALRSTNRYQRKLQGSSDLTETIVGLISCQTTLVFLQITKIRAPFRTSGGPGCLFITDDLFSERCRLWTMFWVKRSGRSFRAIGRLEWRELVSVEDSPSACTLSRRPGLCLRKESPSLCLPQLLYPGLVFNTPELSQFCWFLRDCWKKKKIVTNFNNVFKTWHF